MPRRGGGRAGGAVAATGTRSANVSRARRQRAQIRDDACTCAGVSCDAGGIGVPALPSRIAERDLRIAALHLPRERSDSSGGSVLNARATRAVAQARRRRDRSTQPCTVEPLALGDLLRRVLRSDAEIHHDVPALLRGELGANAGIAVPVTPTEIFRNIIAGATPPISLALPIAGGFGLSAAPAGPSPMPRGAVTRCAVRLDRPPAFGEVERLGRKLERGLASERRGEIAGSSAASDGGRLLRRDGGDDRIEQRRRGNGAIAAASALRQSRASFRKSTASWYSSARSVGPARRRPCRILQRRR